MLLKPINQTAQTSIEFLLVTVIGLTLCVVIISGFAQVNNSTAAIGMIRSITLLELADQPELFVLQKIEGPTFLENETAQFVVKISGPQNLTERTKANLEVEIQAQIQERKIYPQVQVKVEQG
ncbi:MAG: hypothetical protein Q7S92_01805 [Candidatus Diapherotrites archaeon]|nr:hypothetical protein [Candidatus Diapherotrites archaeon]